MATICRPALAVPMHSVPQSEMIDALRTRHAGLETLERDLRLVRNTTVQQRYFIQPLTGMLAREGIALSTITYEIDPSTGSCQHLEAIPDTNVR